jgi:hypothetical protein
MYPPTVSKAFGLDVDTEALAQFLEVYLAAEHERAVPFVDDRLGLDVVLIADFADNLLQQILDCHESRRAAVLVDDDGDLHLLPLEFLQQFVDAFWFRARTWLGRDEWPSADRRFAGGLGALETNSSFTNHHSPTIVVQVSRDRTGKRESSCSPKSARRSSQRGGRRIRDDIGPRLVIPHEVTRVSAEVHDSTGAAPLVVSRSMSPSVSSPASRYA